MHHAFHIVAMELALVIQCDNGTARTLEVT